MSTYLLNIILHVAMSFWSPNCCLIRKECGSYTINFLAFLCKGISAHESTDRCDRYVGCIAAIRNCFKLRV